MALFSRNPLTDLLFSKEPIITGKMKSEPSDHTADNLRAGKDDSVFSCRMAVKVMVQKSINKPLLAEAEESFFDYLFTFLVFPLGKVATLPGCNILLPNIANLYASVSNLSVGKYIKSDILKNMLLHPELSFQFRYGNKSLLSAESYFAKTRTNQLQGEGFLRRNGTFMLTNDWVVTPISSVSSVAYLSTLKVHLNDVEEKVINIGFDEVNLCFKLISV